jgi:dihydropteroate synthase
MPDPSHGPPTPIGIGERLFEWGRRTYVMGIINATPDSFSGDGLLEPARAADRAVRMIEDGADLLDIGAASTRPDHVPVDAGEEWRRLHPVLGAVRRAVDVPLTVDTSRAEVAERAFDAGADALNDVHGLRADRDMAPLLARTGCPAVVMHNQRGREFSGDVIADVRSGLEESFAAAERAGVPRERLIVDPGFGFGWGPVQNLLMLRRLDELRDLGRPVLVGTSRKSTIGYVIDRPEQERQWGTAATVALAIGAGGDIIRVHDVDEMAQVARMADAVVRGTLDEDA